jgi:hypothetical protein
MSLDFLDKDFGARLREACDHLGGVEKAAARIDMTKTPLYNSINGKTEIGAGKVFQLSKITPFRLNWILTGEEPKHHDDPDGYVEIKSDFFFEIVDTVEAFLKDRKMKVTLKNQMRFVLAVYNREMEKAVESGKAPELDKEKLLDMLAYHFDAL